MDFIHDGVSDYERSISHLVQLYQALAHSTQMKRIIPPLLLLLARASEKQLVQYIEYLKTENKILRSKLPKQLTESWVQRVKQEYLTLWADVNPHFILVEDRRSTDN